MRRTGPGGRRGGPRPDWRDELGDLAQRLPRTARMVRGLVRRPLAVLLPVAVVATARYVDVVRPTDTVGFLRAGRSMLTPSVWDVFADPWLQVGPVLLLAMGLWSALGDLLGVSPFLLVGGVHGGLVVWLADVVTRRWVPPDRDPTAARWAVALTLLLGGVMERSFQPGHEEDLLIALLLAAAASAATRGRASRLGLLLALGFGLKAWAVLGGGLVLHRRRWSWGVLAAGTAAGAVLAMYLPFVLGGDVNTLEYSWGITRGGSLLGDLGRHWGVSDWGLRAAQAAVAGLAGAVVALRRHGSALAVVLVAVGVRLLLEPHVLWYYSSPFLLLTVLWVWTSPAVRRTWPRLATLPVVPVFLGHYFFVPADVVQVTEAVLYVGVLTAVLVLERRQHPVISYTAADPPSSTSRTPAGGADRTSGTPSRTFHGASST